MASDAPGKLPDVPLSNSHRAVRYPSSVVQATDAGKERDIQPGTLVNVERNGALLLEDSGTRRRPPPSPVFWHLLLLGGDTLLLVSLLALALALENSARLVHVHSLAIADDRLVWGCLALISWGVASTLVQSRSLPLTANRFKGSLIVLFAVGLMVVCWIVLTRLFLGLEVYGKVDLIFLGVAIPTFVTWRIALAWCMGLPQFCPRAVIVGTNSAGATLAREVQHARRTDLSILGFITEEDGGKTALEHLPVLGNSDTLRKLVQHGMIDTIVMALNYKVDSPLFQETMHAAQSGVSIVPMSVVYERISGKIPVQHIGDQWYGQLPADPVVSPLYLCWRKTLDLTFGLLGTGVLLALLPIFALCIYIDAPGPIFYKQERMGYRGKTFSMLKFRSMRTDAERVGGAVWAAEHDARVTRVGRLLRATHLDELPQVFNILCGEMSLIGPRPERQLFVDRLATIIPFYHCRTCILPGLTGWAQVKYPYASSDHDALIKLQYDLYYIKHRSFMLDSFILLKTVVEVLFCRGR